MRVILDIIGRAFAGPALVLVGVAMLVGLFVLSRIPPDNMYHAVGLFIAVEAYSVVAILFMVVGLRYTLGPRNWIDRTAEKTIGRLVSIIVAGALVVGVCWLLAIL